MSGVCVVGLAVGEAIAVSPGEAAGLAVGEPPLPPLQATASRTMAAKTSPLMVPPAEVKFGECLLVEVILHPLRLPGYRASSARRSRNSAVVTARRLMAARLWAKV